MKIVNYQNNKIIIEGDATVVDLIVEAVRKIVSLSRADLRDADLSGADLRRADLSRANLSGANLSGANLSGANLSGADLREADLSGADLRRAVLRRAVLRRAVLREADLREADLREADLSGANLSGANLSGADLRRANLSGADLRRAKHLIKIMGVIPGNFYWKRFSEGLSNNGYQFYVGLNELKKNDIFASDDRVLCSYPGFHFASKSWCQANYEDRPLEAKIQIPIDAQINEPWATDGKASADKIIILQVFDVATGEDVTDQYRRK